VNSKFNHEQSSTVLNNTTIQLMVVYRRVILFMATRMVILDRQMLYSSIYTGLALACPTDPCTQVLLTNTISCNSILLSLSLSSAAAFGSPEEEEENERVLRIKEDDTDVDLTHARLKKVPAVLRRLKKLEVLSLRQNLIVDLEPLSDLTTLKELDLYDNDLKRIHALERLVNLTFLDLSFNHITCIENLEGLLVLEKLFLIQNKIPRIENLSSLTSLTMLELGSNRIRVIEGLDTLVNLESLFLGKNKITKLQVCGDFH